MTTTQQTETQYKSAEEHETHTHGVKGISLADWKKIKKVYDFVCCDEQGHYSCCPPHKRCKVRIEEYWEDKEDKEDKKRVVKKQKKKYKLKIVG